MDKVSFERSYFWSLPLGAVCGALIVFFLMAFAAGRESAVSVAATQDAALIDVFERTKTEADTSMILLGNSRLRHAVTFGFDPSALVTLPDGRKMAALQFASNAATFGQYMALTNKILAAKPERIVIVDALLSNGRYPLGRPVLAAKAVHDALAQAAFGGSEVDRWKRQRVDIITDCITEFSAAETKARLELTAFRDAHDLDPVRNPNAAAARRLVARAVEAGIKVTILHLPSNPMAEHEAGIPPAVLDFYPLGFAPKPEQLLPESFDKVEWISVTPPLGRADFCDFVHLNDAGRQAYTAWFLGRF